MTLPATGTWAPVTERQKTYAKDTGAINWLSCGTRADIAYTVSRLAEANAGLSQEHLDLMHYLYRYIKGTATYGIELGGSDVDVTDMMM